MSELVDFTYYCRNCKLLLGSLQVKNFKCPECGSMVYIIDHFLCSSCKRKFKVEEAVKNNFKCPNCKETLAIFYERPEW